MIYHMKTCSIFIIIQKSNGNYTSFVVFWRLILLGKFKYIHKYLSDISRR